ncbi:hypothetical protein BKA59DRAFT_469225 [Fusarium tricinctum]|uniref:Uncharacterized protein n=1 Tax=Fusarium tricinctum TaxID=61284 RepID=A0A8K0WFB5_9HYPO|nr:hypothetical protein BKA59DRAFT_469225 [Fusarium tricinctum]
MLLNALEMGICMRPTPALALGALAFLVLADARFRGGNQPARHWSSFSGVSSEDRGTFQGIDKTVEDCQRGDENKQCIVLAA